MWIKLPKSKREEYKRMILAFASLSEMFSQKKTDNDILLPFLNSKYQETVFHKVFDATVEDIDNTSFDASVENDGEKYLIGIKTFSYKNSSQKIAQFKSYHDEFTSLFEKIKRNSLDNNGKIKTKQEIDAVNKDAYIEIARKISQLRNIRIDSSKANLRGFEIKDEKEVECVYHVLMPMINDDKAYIVVGETPYTTIDVDSLEILGCSSVSCPTNFGFKDKNHEYRFTSADSQLLMNFQNTQIGIETWRVYYVDDAYQFFADLADKLFIKQGTLGAISSLTNEEKQKQISESYSWSILNNKGEVELFSGLNGFYGVGSKLSKSIREKKISELRDMYGEGLEQHEVDYIVDGISQYLYDVSKNKEEKLKKVELREVLMENVKQLDNPKLEYDLSKILYRPVNEGYIPIPNSRRFHIEHPDFFVKNGLSFNERGGLINSKEDREFNLIFEPSGNRIVSFIAQDWGKAIESITNMSILGKWILRGVFQLREYEPLTAKKLKEVGINGIRLYKVTGSEDIHLQFIWIDDDDKPEDLWC